VTTKAFGKSPKSLVFRLSCCKTIFWFRFESGWAPETQVANRKWVRHPGNHCRMAWVPPQVPLDERHRHLLTKINFGFHLTVSNACDSSTHPRTNTNVLPDTMVRWTRVRACDVMTMQLIERRTDRNALRCRAKTVEPPKVLGACRTPSWLWALRLTPFDQLRCRWRDFSVGARLC